MYHVYFKLKSEKEFYQPHNKSFTIRTFRKFVENLNNEKVGIAHIIHHFSTILHQEKGEIVYQNIFTFAWLDSFPHFPTFSKFFFKIFRHFMKRHEDENAWHILSLSICSQFTSHRSKQKTFNQSEIWETSKNNLIAWADDFLSCCWSDSYILTS